MRIAAIFSVLALACTGLAAKNVSPYDTYFAKQSSSSPIDLNEMDYESLTSTPRDYAAAVLLTALDVKYACQLCRDFQPEWDLIGKSWRRADKKGEKRMLFGTADFDKNRNVFMKLQLQTAPVLLLYPPTAGPNAKPDGQPIRLDFHGPQTAEGVNSWITRQLPQGDYPEVKRPVNYSRIAISITIIIGIFTIGTVAWPYVLPFLRNRNLWAFISLISVLLFTSGQMFNRIRGTPYVTGNGRGGISYFAGGFSNQFGIETQIVAAMYAVLSFAIIALALNVPRIKNPQTQQVAVIIWAAVMFGMYSFLMSVFRIKNGGYPFYLPPF